MWLKVGGILLVFALLVTISVQLPTALLIGITGVQQTYDLDLELPLFRYMENEFNDSSTSQEYDYSGSGDVTYYVNVPKNSTIVGADMDITGKIIYIYSQNVNDYGLDGISVGDVVYGTENEIVVGASSGSDGRFRVLYGTNGQEIWSKYVSAYPIFSTTIGDVTTDTGNEIAIGSGNDRVYVYDCSDSGATEAWNFPTGGDVNSVAIGDLDGGNNEVVAGSGDGKVYVLDNSGSEKWNFTVDSGGVYSVTIGDLTSHSGNEVAVGADKIYVLNSTGGLVWKKTIGTSVQSVSVGDVTSDPGNEIAAGGGSPGFDLYLFNVNDTDGTEVWDYTINDIVNSVIIGDVTIDAGNEIVAGSDDGRIYTVNGSGYLIWSYDTNKQVRSVAVGNVTTDVGNEVIAGDIPTGAGYGTVYTFNFDYFPTNVSIDVGADSDDDWTSSHIKLRETEGVGGSSFEQGIQAYLDSQCTPVDQMCAVPLRIHSDWAGKLETSNLDFTYDYNTTGRITYQIVGCWSRVSGIVVNESVGNQCKNITFSNTAVDVQIREIAVNNSATTCDFNLTKRGVSGNACDVPDFTVPSSGSPPGPVLFWEDTMSTGIPVVMTETEHYYTTEVDNYFLKKNLSIYNTSSTTITDVNANTSLDFPEITGMVYLNVYWGSQWCNITPVSGTPDCDTGSPTYTQIACNGDDFWVCMEDTDNNTIVDLFKWRQPHTSQMPYETGGAVNLGSELENESVTPAQDIWGSGFNFSINVTDTDDDDVNVTLWVRGNRTGNWSREGSVVVNGNGTALFNVVSDKFWTGLNSYRFEFFDFNASNTSQYFHSPVNTSTFSGPEGIKHNVSLVHYTGNNSVVFRKASTPLAVRINDTDTGTWIGAGTNCTFWVTTDLVNPDQGHINTSNTSGICSYGFMPDGNYSVGNQTWLAGVSQDEYYNDANSSNFLVFVKGRMNINLSGPLQDQVLIRNTSQHLEASLSDEYGMPIGSTTANTSGYTCSFYFNNTWVGNSTPNASGVCTLSHTPGCTYSLGYYPVNVSLSGPVSENYTVNQSASSTQARLFDNITISILAPANHTLYYRGETIDLNSTVNDTCQACQPADFGVTWYKEWKGMFRLQVNETAGLSRTNEPVVVNGSWLQSYGLNLSEWRINYTRVLVNGQEVPAQVWPWTDGGKTAMNHSKAYPDQYSELVFLVNLTPYQSRHAYVHYREDSTKYNLSYVPHSGFESGVLSPWQCIRIDCSPIFDCVCALGTEGSETAGSYSLNISAEEIQSNNIMGAKQTLNAPLYTDRIKVRYKPWGEFLPGAYLRLQAGGGTCNLPVTPGTPYASATWREHTCYDTGFSGATSINLTIHDVGSGGGGISASHAIIDYTCSADAAGNCLVYHSGASQDVPDILFRTQIGSGENMSWNMPVNETVGSRVLLANASGTFYIPDQDYIPLYIFGWANLSSANISSPDCLYHDGNWTCRLNATVTNICRVQDVNTTDGVKNYNVTFFGDDSYLGFNYTNLTGYGQWCWPDSTDEAGMHNVSCDIDDYPQLFYNVTANNSLLVNFTTNSTTTTGQLFQSPAYMTAPNLTIASNVSFQLNLTILNNGTGPMYNPVFNISTPTGIYPGFSFCPVIPAGESCTNLVNMTVSALAATGNNTIDVTLSWYNGDGGQDSVANQSTVFVEDNTVLDITETVLEYQMPRGTVELAGNFTVQAFGNTEIINITFNESGGDAQNISSWINYTPSNISSISKLGNQPVNVTVSVPLDTLVGSYTTDILANATGSSCSPEAECWDSILFNLTVKQYDWDVEPDTVTKKAGISSPNGTAGSVRIRNNMELTNYTFNLTLTGNGTTYLTLPTGTLDLENKSSKYLAIQYNRTGDNFTVGTWTSNLTITNWNATAIPQEWNVSVTLDVVNLLMNIIFPDASNQSGPLNASDMLNMTVNVTMGLLPVPNMTWSPVEVGGHACANLSASYNITTSLWYLSCSAPPIPGNPINNSLHVSGTYTTEDIDLETTQYNAVRYEDLTPPAFPYVNVTPVYWYDSEPLVPVTVNVTDNTEVDTVWVTVMLPNSTVENITNCTSPGANQYAFNFTNPNILGDYNVTVYANDTKGLLNATTAWFDVYNLTQFGFYSANPKGTGQNITVRFYKPGTDWAVHEYATNQTTEDYDWDVHKRFYDIGIDAFGHTITLNSADANGSAISDAFRLDNFPNRTSEDITKVSLPETADASERLLAFVIEPNLNFSSGSFIMDYSDALSAAVADGVSVEEADLRLFICENWDYFSRTCQDGEFDHLNESAVPNLTTRTFTFASSPGSAYTIAKSCYPNICGEAPPSPPGGNGPNIITTGGGGGSGRDDTPSSVCGNKVCELGENIYNCPADCGEKYPFIVETGLTDILISPGSMIDYPLLITNTGRMPLSVAFEVTGKVKENIKLERYHLELGLNETDTQVVQVLAPARMDPGTYTGTLRVTAGDQTQSIPIVMKVTLAGLADVSLVLDLITKTVTPGSSLRYVVKLRNLGLTPDVNLTMEYHVTDMATGRIIKKTNESVNLIKSKTYTRTLILSDVDLPVGDYYLDVWALFEGKSVQDLANFEVVIPFFETGHGRMVLFFSFVAESLFVLYYGRRRYKKWKLARSRYVFPVNYKKLPQGSKSSYCIGSIAETPKQAWFNPKDLTTHLLVAGATGSGKSVGASVFVEEALNQNIPVIVFDPTAQWTGFVKACTDDNLLKNYEKFSMKKRDARPYKGMIFEVMDPNLNLDFKKYMNPGEVTVFTLNKLKPGEYDVAVKNIVDSMFKVTWEEATTLRMLVVFDEVHRLLEKYGGKGGYVALEKAAREFRKWGIGLIMCSQVLADFKTAIAGNVLTEVQLNTKSLTDISKVEEKYGKTYSRKISREAVGVGMIQNPKYNDGKPYFVNFRPTYHNPHKISNEEMDVYKGYAARLKVMEERIAKMEKRGQDVFDIKLELKLATDKLKLGRFRMAEIYISSLEQHLNIKPPAKKTAKGGKK